MRHSTTLWSRLLSSSRRLKRLVAVEALTLCATIPVAPSGANASSRSAVNPRGRHPPCTLLRLGRGVCSSAAEEERESRAHAASEVEEISDDGVSRHELGRGSGDSIAVM